MLIRSLASNYLKSILRSRFGKLNLAVKILAIVFMWMPLYLYAIGAGLFIDLAFNELAFNVDMPAIASRVVLYFLIFWSGLDILLRTRISLPLFPYLTTPITRRKLALFYQAISAFGKINLLPFLFVLAFWFRNFLLKDIAFAWAWLLLFLSLSACFHLAANLLRISLGRRYLPMLCTLLFVVALAAMEWRYDIPTLSGLSTALFEATLGGAVWPSGHCARCGRGGALRIHVANYPWAVRRRYGTVPTAEESCRERRGPLVYGRDVVFRVEAYLEE